MNTSIKIRSVGRGIPYPKDQDSMNIPAFSRGSKPWKELSPFFIRVDPELIRDNPKEHCLLPENGPIFENWWQSFKVYEDFIDAENDGVVIDSKKWSKWTEWRTDLLNNPKAIRRPMGKKIPLYAYYNDSKLNVIESRRLLYIKFLQILYRKHKVYQQLLELVRKGQNITILGPDGFPHELFPNGLEVSLELLVELQSVTDLHTFLKIVGYPFDSTIKNKYFPYGHEYVLALTILEDLKTEK